MSVGCGCGCGWVGMGMGVGRGVSRSFDRRRRGALAKETVFSGGSDDKIFPMLFHRVFRRFLPVRQTLDVLFSQNSNAVFLLASSCLFLQKFFH